MNKKAPIIYLPHGGGPLPLLGDASHESLIDFLKSLSDTIDKPDAIVLISAHWEEAIPTITRATQSKLLFDYYGFPDESYSIEYPAKDSPILADKIKVLLKKSSIKSAFEYTRGYDHGFFVPLKLVYPQADIPCVQLSLVQGLNAEQHILLGQCLAELRENNVMIIGSGMSFHNMRALMHADQESAKQASDAFDHWLITTCTNEKLSTQEKAQRLIHWEQAPYARFAHPREEHLLPLHVCFGAASVSNANAKLIYNAELMGHKVSGFQWD